nr:hypothetical protein Itr_chr13CG03610 [Ipomoea trifida]
MYPLDIGAGHERSQDTKMFIHLLPAVPLHGDVRHSLALNLLVRLHSRPLSLPFIPLRPRGRRRVFLHILIKKSQLHGRAAVLFTPTAFFPNLSLIKLPIISLHLLIQNRKLQEINRVQPGLLLGHLIGLVKAQLRPEIRKLHDVSEAQLVQRRRAAAKPRNERWLLRRRRGMSVDHVINHLIGIPTRRRSLTNMRRRIV